MPDQSKVVITGAPSRVAIDGENVTIVGVTCGDALTTLGDPGADRIVFWDDSAGAWAYLTAGSGLSISGTTITASGGGSYQPLDSDLTAIAALTTTSYGRALLTLANAAAADWLPLAGGTMTDGAAITLPDAVSSVVIDGSSAVWTTGSASATISPSGITVSSGITSATLNASGLAGNATTATTLATGRTLAITGDLTWTSPTFDGSGNVTAAGTLATVNSNVGSFGSATAATIFTVNAKGLVTAASSATITPAVGSITGLGTGVAAALAVAVGSTGAFVVVNGALGTPSSGTLTSCTGYTAANIASIGSGVATLITTAADGTSASAIGYQGIPQNSKSADYTVAASDDGKHIYHPGADTTARTWTINSNTNLALPIGFTVTFVNDTLGGVITIAITTDTLVLAGTGATGSRSLAASGMATAVKMTSTRWMISGSGLT